MEYLALESVETLPIGKMTLGCEAKGGDQVLAIRSAAVLSLNSPFHGFVVELCIDNSAVKRDVLPNV